MSPRTRTALATGLALVAMLAVEALGLRAGTSGVLLVGAVIALALAVIVFRLNLATAGVAVTCATAFTLTWNGWFVGPLRPGDALIFVSLICFVLARPNNALRTPPWWIKQLTLAIVLVAAVQIFVPPDLVYLSQRVRLDAVGKLDLSGLDSLVSANIVVALKFIVAVALVPMAFAGAVLVDRRSVRWLAMSFVTGSALSGWAAFADHFGGNFGRLITGKSNTSDRQIGFSDHPNFLAAGATISIPLAIWLILSERRRDRVIGYFCLVGLLGGVFASGSRGGAVCSVLALVLCAVVHERLRASAPVVAIGSLFLVGTVIAFVPALGAQILKVTRLSGNPNVGGSNTVRTLVGAQGVRDFKHAPIAGIGLQSSFDASQVYLQELASGGLILFTGMTLYMFGAMMTSYRYRTRDPLAASILATVVVTLALNVFEADLTDRFYYVPIAILVALVVAHEGEDAATTAPVGAGEQAPPSPPPRTGAIAR